MAGEPRSYVMKTMNNTKSGNVVRGQTYTALRYQPKRVFCMSEDLTSKLDEFLWNREHAKVAERPIPAKPAAPVQQRIAAHINAVKAAQQARHAAALKLFKD